MKIAKLLLLAVLISTMFSSCIVAMRPGYGHGPRYHHPPPPPRHHHGHYHH